MKLSSSKRSHGKKININQTIFTPTWCILIIIIIITISIDEISSSKYRPTVEAARASAVDLVQF